MPSHILECMLIVNEWPAGVVVPIFIAKEWCNVEHLKSIAGAKVVGDSKFHDQVYRRQLTKPRPAVEIPVNDNMQNGQKNEAGGNLFLVLHDKKRLQYQVSLMTKTWFHVAGGSS